MLQIRWVRGGLILALSLMALAALGPGAGGAKEPDAGAFLLALSRDASLKLGSEQLSEVEKEANFRRMFRSAFDVAAISRFVLGKYWRSATDAQREAFMATFEELHMRRFLPLFAKYDDKSITVESVQTEDSKPNFFRVNSRIVRDEGEPIGVVWRIRDTGESYQILDVVAEGVSMAISLRHEYGAVAKADGIDGLLEQMRSKSAELAAE